MGESDESLFWTENEEDGYHYFEPNEAINDEEESGAKRIRLSPEFNHQEGDADSSGQSSPLGLTLKKTPSFLNLLQRTLSKGAEQTQPSNLDNSPQTKIDDLGSHQSQSEKLKASNFPAVFIQIGNWKRITRHEGDLTAKLYYAKRKLVWEVLDGALKSKIEIQWSDIVGIRAVTTDNEPGTLEIELNQPPLFYREMTPQPRKHTLWQQASDFTGGQAPILRRHLVRFPPGILDKHYEKLLQCDQRLLALSQKPFPSNESPYFDPTMFAISEHSLNFSGYRASGYQYPYQNCYPAPAMGHFLRPIPNSTSGFTVIDPAFGYQGGSSGQFMSNQGPSYMMTTTTPLNPVFHPQSFEPMLNGIEEHLLGESQVSFPDDGSLCANMAAMSSFLEPSDVNPNNYHTNHSIARNCDNSNDHQHDHDQVMQSIGGNVYPISEPLNWVTPPQVPNNNIALDESLITPFMFPTNTDF